MTVQINDTESIELSENATIKLAEISEGRSIAQVITELIDIEYSKAPMGAQKSAKYLGISTSDFYKKVKAGLIPAHKPFGKWSCYRKELDQLIRSSDGSRDAAITKTDMPAAEQI